MHSTISEDRICNLSPNDRTTCIGIAIAAASLRFGAGTPMLVDADGDYAHEFWEENKAPVCVVLPWLI